MEGRHRVLVRKVKLALLLILLTTRCNYSLNILESNPMAVNGTLTTCSDNQIAITCSHNQTETRSTTWNVSPPVNCSTVITHRPNPAIPPCGSSTFMFQGVNSLSMSGTTVLNSTAVVTATVMVSGSVVECRGGNRVGSISVGNISLCVVGQLPPPANLQCMNTPNGLLITWNPVTDTSCAESPVAYNVTVISRSDGVVIESMPDFVGNTTEVLNKTKPSIDYSVLITARTTIALCDGKVASTICMKSAAYEDSVSGFTPLNFLTLIISTAATTLYNIIIYMYMR